MVEVYNRFKYDNNYLITFSTIRVEDEFEL